MTAELLKIIGGLDQVEAKLRDQVDALGEDGAAVFMRLLLEVATERASTADLRTASDEVIQLTCNLAFVLAAKLLLGIGEPDDE